MIWKLHKLDPALRPCLRPLLTLDELCDMCKTQIFHIHADTVTILTIMTHHFHFSYDILHKGEEQAVRNIYECTLHKYTRYCM